MSYEYTTWRIISNKCFKREIWKDIPGYVGFYQISSCGQVKSLAKKTRGINGGTYTSKERLLKPWKLSRYKLHKSHLQIRLTKNGVHKGYFVHELVLLAFVGPRPEGMICRHFPDRNPWNNWYGNLQWGTYLDNSNDQKIHGTSVKDKCQRGEKQYMAKLTNEKVKEIRKLYAGGGGQYTKRELAHKFDISWERIHSIVLGKAWTHVT